MASASDDTMEAVLNLSPEEARTYSMILDAAATLPKSDPRFALTLTFTWWLLHRRRRLEQERVRRRQFYRRLRRLIFLRWHLQKNTLSGAAAATSQNVAAAQDGLVVVPEKRIWVRNDRNEDFWTKVDKNTLSPEAFRKYFHMSKDTFDYVYDELAEQLQKSNTSMRDPLPGKLRLAATLYRMATNAEYIKVASLFGIGKSTTTSLVRDVCDVIVSNLKDKFLTFVGEGHNRDEMQRKINDSASKFGIPRVTGVLGSIDVLIIGSSWDWSENSPYISSYHKNYAVTFQAVVDHDGQFCHVTAGTPSSLTNRQTLEQCGMRKDFLDKFTFPTSSVDQGNQNEKPVPIARIVADESYSATGHVSNEINNGDNNSMTEDDDSSWLLTPKEVPNETNDEDERQLVEEKITRARNLFDEAVINVKSRWKIFHGKNGKINFSADAFEKIALACCILHNICTLQEDHVDPSWGSDIGPEIYYRRGFPKHSPVAENITTHQNHDQGEMDQLNEIDEDLGGEEEDEEFDDEIMEEEEDGEGGEMDGIEDISMTEPDDDGADGIDNVGNPGEEPGINSIENIEIQEDLDQSMTSADDVNATVDSDTVQTSSS